MASLPFIKVALSRYSSAAQKIAGASDFTATTDGRPEASKATPSALALPINIHY